ncbi:MAG TPA: hypothetical protein VNN73_00425 [Blastocatellia bacterium]|nr:hypothetical protein [Blastocatellia bacterium]
MRFTKPINREVDIDGNTFIVSFDDKGIDFRLKGKRRTAHVDWTRVLNVAEGEQGANAREFLGIEGATRQAETPTASPVEPQLAGERTESAQPFEPQGVQATGEAATTETPETRREDEELGRAVTAGNVGPES